MSQQSHGPSRLSRTAAKEVPHRAADRFFAAKSAARTACEQLAHDVRRAPMHEAKRLDLLRAIERVQRELNQVTLETPDARAVVVDLEHQVQHLQVAEKWISASDRVLDRLGNHGSRAVREDLVQAQETVMWCVRAEHWDGQLTAALTGLQSTTQLAEAQAARQG